MKTFFAILLTIVCMVVLPAGPGTVLASDQPAQVYFLSKATAEPVPESRNIPVTPAALVAELLRGPQDVAHYSPFGTEVQLHAVRVERGCAIIDLSKDFAECLSQDNDMDTVLRLTLSQVSGLTSYRITVEGSDAPCGSHVDFSESLDLGRDLASGLAGTSVVTPQGEIVPYLYVLVDPGHGGSDPGAYNWEVPGSVLEKNVVLDIGTHVYSWVDGRSDATAYMTRYDDSYLLPSERVALANDLYSSGHATSSSLSIRTPRQ